MKNIIIVSLIFLSVFSYSQDHAKDLEEIKTLSEEVMKLTDKGEYEKVMDYMYDPFFDLFTRDEIKEFLRIIFEGNEEFRIEIDASNPNFSYSEIYKKEDTKYSFVGHSVKMKMTFLNQEIDEEDKYLMGLNMRAQGLEVLDFEGNSVTVLSNNSVMILINDKNTNGKWKSMNFDSDNAFVYQLLPTYVIEDAQKFQEKLMLQNAKKREAKTESYEN